MAAVVFLRVLKRDNTAHVTLIGAKIKVAPLKRMTIPRLELSTAVLLVHQVIKIRDALKIHNISVCLWTDSTVALTWIKGHPSRWKNFVRNRVSFIQTLSNSRWYHVSEKENPADLASRRLPPQNLQNESLWWSGPAWLRSGLASWPSSTFSTEPTTDLEESSAFAHITVEEPELWDLINRYSSLTTLFRITAWLIRASKRFRKLATSRFHQAVLTSTEIDSILLFWVQLMQQASFPKKIPALSNNKPLSTSSSLLRLAPLIDSQGLLRLRGRLQNSNLEFAEKHPLILPRDSRLSKIIGHHHRRT